MCQCPLHGKIIPRDYKGQPLVSDADNVASTKTTKFSSDVNVGASTSRGRVY